MFDTGYLTLDQVLTGLDSFLSDDQVHTRKKLINARLGVGTHGRRSASNGRNDGPDDVILVGLKDVRVIRSPNSEVATHFDLLVRDRVHALAHNGLKVTIARIRIGTGEGVLSTRGQAIRLGRGHINAFGRETLDGDDSHLLDGCIVHDESRHSCSLSVIRDVIPGGGCVLWYGDHLIPLLIGNCPHARAIPDAMRVPCIPVEGDVVVTRLKSAG